MQGCRARRRHPRRRRAGAHLPHLLLEHVGHQVRHRPHALADLRMTGQTGAQTDLDVVLSRTPMIHGWVFMSLLRTTGPAAMAVWISSPERSRKPVLMKMTRSRAALIAACRLSVVRRSSSMMPILSVLGSAARATPRRARTAAPQRRPRRDRASSASRCRPSPRCRSHAPRLTSSPGIAQSAVSAASRNVSKISAPSASSTASVRMWRADVANQQQRTPRQRDRRAVRAGELAIVGETPDERIAAPSRPAR